MSYFLSVAFLLQVVVASKPKEEPLNYAFPPPNQFCLFTSGEFVFADKMKELAPSATLGGVGTVQNIYADQACEPMKLWGAMYYISNDEKTKVEEFAYEERLTIADVMITKKDGSESMDCVSMDVGIVPHAYPLPVFKEFSKHIPVKDYLEKLAQIGVPREYVHWLGTLPANSKDSPTPAYVVCPSFYAPPTQGCPPPFNNGIGPAIQPYEIPENQVCVFVSGELIFEKAMKSLVPSAKLIGAAMLGDEYVGVGCPTQPDKFVKYKGLDHGWGVAYNIDKADLEKFTKLGGEKHRFTADVRIIVEGLMEANCKTNDVGMLPSGFPFRVFGDGTKLDLDSYTKRLKEVGVPSGYADALEQLKIKLDTYTQMAKNPVVYELHDVVN